MNNDQHDGNEIERFNHALDQLLSGAQIQTYDLDSSVAEIAIVLASPAAVILSRQRDQLRKRLLSSSATRTYWRLNLAPGLVVLLLVGALTVTVMTTLRAPVAATYTGNILGEVGGCVITDGLTWAQKYDLGTPPATTGTHPPESTEHRSDDPLEASNLAGFDILVPQVLPRNAVLNGIFINVYTDGANVWQMYSVPAEERAQPRDDDGFMGLQQWQLTHTDPHCEYVVGDATVIAVVVRGQSGYWVQDSPLKWMPDQIYRQDMLLWAENNFLFSIQATDLTLEEALVMAESLIPASQMGQ